MTDTTSSLNNRIGFHYFTDTAHYTNKDLNTYLPFLEEMGAKWLVLRSETSRAIPETFISGLVNKGIQPIIHFPLRLPEAPSAADLKAILNAYAKWGAKYVILFDRPNDRSAWSASGWSQTNLVENFLDRFIPLANECLNAGLTPVFPALEPGGSYWDLSFIRTALAALQRRGQKKLLETLVLADYGFTFGHELDWGLGGPQSWSENKPYITPANSQDQKGFRNFEWIEAMVQTVLGKSLPMLLLGLGKSDSKSTTSVPSEEQYSLTKDIIANLRSTDSVPESVLVGAFWTLAAAEDEERSSLAWINADGSASVLCSLLGAQNAVASKRSPIRQGKQSASQTTATGKTIEHYLLLPLYEWGVADWHLEVIKPFVLKHHPTIGFSLSEAALAKTVTVIGGEQNFSEENLNELRTLGCEVERISGDGTTIATQLSER
ncbi:MAG: hypothetical protein VB013_10170 [Anaerolineaceae bacterium]|nr:hypothetical protein [Anaerolineaceae bacterium]